MERRAFDSIGQRPSEIRAVLLEQVDRRCNECSRFLVLVAQLPVPGVNLFEQDNDPSHPHSITLAFYNVYLLSEPPDVSLFSTAPTAGTPPSRLP